MAITKREPLSEAKRAELRRDPDVIYRRRAEEQPTPFVSGLRATGEMSGLQLLGRCDDEDDAREQ
jgi:hypothetical protein